MRVMPMNRKASIIAINKWDLVEKETDTMEEYRKKVYQDLEFMNYAPVVFISAKTGSRINGCLSLLIL